MLLLLLLLRVLQPDQAALATLAVSIALSHPALSTEPRVLCAAARTCRARRQAVQQCSACNTAVAFNFGAYTAS
jgi:hypothetical protein